MRKKSKTKKKIIKKPTKDELEIKEALTLLGKNKDEFDKLLRLIQDVGDYNINYNALSKEWGIPDTTLYRWKDKILAELPPIDPKKVGSKIMRALDSAIRQAHIKMRTAKSETAKARWAKVLGDLSKDMTLMLESYGRKAKVADKHEFDGAVDLGFMQQVYEETKSQGKKK